MDQPGTHPGETFNPWSVVNLVFHHLADQGLHPVLGESGDPGAPAAELLRALGIQPAAEGNRGSRRKSRISSPSSGTSSSVTAEPAAPGRRAHTVRADQTGLSHVESPVPA